MIARQPLRFISGKAQPILTRYRLCVLLTGPYSLERFTSSDALFHMFSPLNAFDIIMNALCNIRVNIKAVLLVVPVFENLLLFCTSVSGVHCDPSDESSGYFSLLMIFGVYGYDFESFTPIGYGVGELPINTPLDFRIMIVYFIVCYICIG